MSYLTVKDEVSSEFEEKKSVFIGHIKRVYKEEEARSFIDKIRSENKEATHNVYAYVIGQNMGIQRYSDDGEPQGTAGIPVLDVIKKNTITDVVVVVTRYFGGVLLGAGGLVRAYAKGAALAIKESGVVEKVKGLIIEVDIEYDLLGKLQYLFCQKSWHIESTEYSDRVKVSFYCESSKVDEVRNAVIEISSGRANIKTSEESYYFKMENRLFEEY